MSHWRRPGPPKSVAQQYYFSMSWLILHLHDRRMSSLSLLVCCERESRSGGVECVEEIFARYAGLGQDGAKGRAFDLVVRRHGERRPGSARVLANHRNVITPSDFAETEPFKRFDDLFERRLHLKMG